MTDGLYDFPAWVWWKLADERLTWAEYMSAEQLCAQFESLGVELDAIGAMEDPDGLAAYRGAVQIGSQLRQPGHPKGWYEALHALCQEVAASPIAA